MSNRGWIYRSVEVEYGYRKATTVAIIYGNLKAICASDTLLEGEYVDVPIRELWSGVGVVMTVGVSDKPFGTGDIDYEGVCAILGGRFLARNRNAS